MNEELQQDRLTANTVPAYTTSATCDHLEPLS